MAFQIKVVGNYVVVTDTTLAKDINSFPVNHSAYRENDETFVILENIDTEVQTIVKADIDAGDWVDDLLAPFTRATMLTFLRDNTAFKGGGASTFEDLTDVPSYAGNALKWLRINSAEDGIEASNLPSLDYTSGTFAVQIAGGAWNYFALLQDAIDSIATDGVVEMLNNYIVTETNLTNPISILNKTITINLNGNKFQNDYDSGASLFTIDNSVVSFTNGRIIANRPVGVSSPSFYVMRAINNSVVNLSNIIMSTDFSRGWNVTTGSEVNGGIIKSRYGVNANTCTLNNVTAISSLAGRAFSGSFMTLNFCYGESEGSGVAGFFFGGRISHSVFVSDTGFGLTMQQSYATHCTGISNSNAGIYCSTGGAITEEPMIMNCVGISNLNSGIYVFRGKAFNSVGRSNLGNGILANIDAEVYDCVGTSVNGIGMNITANSGVGTKTIVRGGVARSVNNSGVLFFQGGTNTYIEVDGLRAESERNDALGVGFYVSNVQAGHNGIFLRGCSATTINNSFAGIYGAGGVKAVSYVQCDLSKSSGVLQITQQAVSIEDAQGNII